jgi:hypothetical protein
MNDDGWSPHEAWKRQRLRIGAFVLAVPAFFWLVPFVPYAPKCEDPRDAFRDYIEGSYNEDFVQVLRRTFRGSDVYYWRFGNVFLLRYGVWEDAWQFWTFGFDVEWAEQPAILGLLGDRHGVEVVGTELNGRVYRVPSHLERFRRPDGRWYEPHWMGWDEPPMELDCDLVEAVVLERPADTPE